MAIALTPLAVYFMLMGLINLSRRPLITTGARDTAALGVAISGLIAAGPMELFLPESASNRFGGYVWLLLIAFYVLCLTLIVLTMRPRLIIYNATPEQLRPILAKTVASLDSEARWAGDSLVLPKLGVQLYLETHPVMRNAHLVAAGLGQSYSGWKQLETALIKVVRETRSSRNPYGWTFLALGIAMMGIVALQLLGDPNTLMPAINNMLRR